MKNNWQSYRSLLKSFYLAIEPEKKPDGKSPYITGWNDCLKSLELASELWFTRMDKIN